ncbi:hypothetical protein BDZ97DRAFT_1824910 [Flammula alnicola]|nr:hypothetical protein BDZ97DRAFT_1824910 [Flammula alnicola]
MPVDTTRVITPRRTQKKLTEEELKDIDRKRLLGELSCAECRRLKLRCDKKVPCGSCYRRGCESICPLGILAAGQGTRFILADTEQLHEKIYEMSNRIRQLEDALAILQSTGSDQRHPLLTDELLKIKFGSEAINARQENSDEDGLTNKSIDALGTLTLGSSGEIQYFGRSAGSERAGEEAGSSDDDKQDGTHAPLDMFHEVEKLANLFPFTAKGRPNTSGLELLETFLPSRERASQLCDSFTNHAAYFFRPIKSDELLNVLLPSIYDRIATRKEDGPTNSEREHGPLDSDIPHALATLYFIFALGCLLDIQLPPFSSEAEKYYDLGRASLSLRAVYDSPNMYSVQAMGLMATYHSLAGKKYTRDSAWCVMSFAAKLAQSVHRDSARWNMDPSTVQKRRNLFWESLALGRPSAIHLSYVDCEFPLDDDASLGDTAENHTGFWRMKHRFAKDIYSSVADATLIARAPNYSTILDLDRKVREISFPASFNPYVTKEVGPEIFHSSSLCLRDFYASQHRTVTMIYLHRSFFAQAMLDHPTNPLLSPFAPSFLTAYRSASVIIKASAHLFERSAEMGMRVWFLMYHTFSAAVRYVGSVVTRSPNSNIASIAMRDFNLAYSLFERSAVNSQRAKVALGVLSKLRDKASRLYEQFSGNNLGVETTPSPGLIDDIEDDLAIFGGQMRVLDRKGKPPHQRSSSSSTGSAASSPQTPSSGGVSPTSGPAKLGFGLALPDVHPSLITYLNQDVVRRTMSMSPATAGLTATSISISEPHIPPSQITAQNASQMRAPWKEAASDQTGTRSTASLTGPSLGEQDGRSTSSQRTPFAHAPIQPPQYLSIPETSRDWSTSTTPTAGGLAGQELGASDRSKGANGGGTANRAGQANPNLPRLSTLPQSTFPRVAALPNMDISQSFGLPDILPPRADPSRKFDAATSGYFGNPPVDFTSYPFGGRRSAGAGVDLNTTFNWLESGLNAMDPTGAVEMGLSSESGMDAGWISFMRDCGIMDTATDP